MKSLFNLRLFLISLSLNLFCAAEPQEGGMRFSAVPALGISPDSGFGGGIIGSLYVDDEGFSPYKMAVGAKIFLTTKGVHSHELSLDRIGAFGLPLRLIGRLGFYSSIAQNFCGFASDARCDMARARDEAEALGLKGSGRERFLWQFYKNRFMSFFGEIYGRWQLGQKPAKLEFLTSYRGAYYLNRDFINSGAYPSSLFSRTFKDKIEGYLSTLEVGLMLDDRDNEPSPTSGYWLEGTVRGGGAFIGSAWSYLGANLSARFYLSLDDDRKLVIASQSIADATVGDLPFDAMSRIGGTQAQNEASAIGGKTIGRGISEQLYVGRFKLIEQLELRYTFLSFTALRQDFDLTAAALGDFAMTAWDYDRFFKDMKKVYVGFGGGLRVSWNKNFVIRADLGVSPSENFSPKFYLTVGNVF